jgi:hypothetical protein
MSSRNQVASLSAKLLDADKKFLALAERLKRSEADATAREHELAKAKVCSTFSF